MKSFEFEIIRNLTGVEGLIEGRFALESNQTSVLETLMELGTSTNHLIIPIFKNEFGRGNDLGTIMSGYESIIPGIVTFGGANKNDTQRSHMAITAREIVQAKPTFLLPLLKIPDQRDINEWMYSSYIDELHAKVGSVAVKDNLCIISFNQRFWRFG